METSSLYNTVTRRIVAATLRTVHLQEGISASDDIFFLPFSRSFLIENTGKKKKRYIYNRKSAKYVQFFLLQSTDSYCTIHFLKAYNGTSVGEGILYNIPTQLRNFSKYSRVFLDFSLYVSIRFFFSTRTLFWHEYVIKLFSSFWNRASILRTCYYSLTRFVLAYNFIRLTTPTVTLCITILLSSLIYYSNFS